MNESSSRPQKLDLKAFLISLTHKKFFAISVAFLLCGLQFCIQSCQTTESANSGANDTAVGSGPDPSIDTFIPNGFQLVPISIANKDEVSALVDRYALVDLYGQSTHGGRGTNLAQSVRLIRSPRNPEVFGVLIEQNLAEPLLAYGGDIVVALRNPKNDQKTPRALSQRRRIVLED
jgi:hypothetical protein